MKDTNEKSKNLSVKSWRNLRYSQRIMKNEMKNYNSKREDLEEEDQGEDERNVIL